MNHRRPVKSSSAAAVASYEHESDSGLSGSLTDSTSGPGRGVLPADVTGTPQWFPGTCYPEPYSPLTGSYCPARAADARRPARTPGPTTSPQHSRSQIPAKTRSFERTTTLERPRYDTFVWLIFRAVVVTRASVKFIRLDPTWSSGDQQHVRPDQWRNYNFWAPRQIFATGPVQIWFSDIKNYANFNNQHQQWWRHWMTGNGER